MRKNEEEKWMRLALRLAARGRGKVSPNPEVGACVVANSRLAGQGYHSRFGGPHAEIAALRQAGRKAANGVLFVTLEPCCTWGKTPPCVDAVIDSGVRKVVVGALDPNPAHAGKGVRKLRRAGIEVTTGVLKAEAEALIEPFRKWVTTGYPFVTLKMAQSLDGKIATASGESKWITSAAARRRVRKLRLEHDAILVGKNTAFADDPRLEAPGRGGKPWRVVLDPQGQLPRKARVFAGRQLTLRAVSEKSLGVLRKRGVKAGALLPVPETGGRLNLRALLRRLGELGVASVLVEGGGETAWSLLNEKLADRVVWFVAPRIIGGRQALTSVEGEGIARLDRALPLRKISLERVGPDFMFEARL